MPSESTLRLAVFGDAGNSYTNGTSFYYSPGAYRRYDLGSSGPLQQAVAAMMRSWNPSDVIQLGDESYNVNSSSLLDINIGQYYNNWIYPYAPPAYTQPGSIYTDGELGGISASEGRRQWPYNLYNYPYGFPHPADASKRGGSSDGVNHYFAVPGNHDEATILGSYNDANVNQVNFGGGYIGAPIGPDAYDYQNNIIKDNKPANGTPITSKVGSNQQLLDYHAYLGEGNAGNLKPGSLNIGKLDPNGYGIYYGVDLGDDGNGRPLLHATIIDTSRLLTDAGYYAFNFAPNANNEVIGPNGEATTKRVVNPGYDVRDPSLSASKAWFQPASNQPEESPSIGRQMFLWAQDDLQRSNAAWKIVMGHHPAYHAGNAKSDDDDSYSSNAVVLNFLQGLKDGSGKSLFNAYMNGHSHAYGRVLEMQDSPSGIGTGIPFFTIGDSGKVLDALNLAPYGTDVLSPINYSTFIGYDKDGNALYNYDINDASVEAPFLQPYAAAKPTSTGISGYYIYSKSNWPEGNGYNPVDDPAKTTVISASVDPITNESKKFGLYVPTYLSYLSSQSDLSGLYGFGSGAAQVDAGDSYLMVHYKTAQPIDPAIALIGRSQGISSFDPQSLFYQQWSPRSAKLADLGLFSFDIDALGSLTNVQLVQSGHGYFETALGASSYLDVDQDFEILGNNPIQPLGFGSSDPTRAVVRLSFRSGQLAGVTLVSGGSDYQQLANAIKQSNNSGSSTVTTDQKDARTGDWINNSLLVGINIDLEAQYTLAASRPTGSDPYHDWYLITDTGLASAQSQSGGAFGALTLNLQARSPQAQDILATTAITTGYDNLGPQRAYPQPQTGGLQLIDAFGNLVGQGEVNGGSSTLTLSALPAPGAVKVAFDGDATSSYQVNFRGIDLSDDIQLQLRYGSWSGPIQQQGTQLQLSTAQTLQVVRSDSGAGRVDVGLSDGSTSLLLLSQAGAASTGALQAEDLFISEAARNWLSSEGQAQGGAGGALVAAGSWRPTAVLDGVELALASLDVAANGAVARFAAGRPDDSSDDVLATFSLPGSGSTGSNSNGVLTIRRLSGQGNGLALYGADPITGAVRDGAGNSLLPGEAGYLQAALATARRDGLVFAPQELPGFGQTSVRSDLPLPLDRNYGALLLVNGNDSELLSSYAAANPGGANQCLSLITPGRGISFAFEDRLPWQDSDRDFNDLSVTLTTAQPFVIA